VNNPEEEAAHDGHQVHVGSSTPTVAVEPAGRIRVMTDPELKSPDEPQTVKMLMPRRTQLLGVRPPAAVSVHSLTPFSLVCT